MPDEKKSDRNGVDSFRTDFVRTWNAIPNKVVFFILLGAWLALFQFLGNSVLGYIDTPSLFGWMKYVYSGDPDSEHGMLIPLAVLALFWWKRDQLLTVPKRIWWPALGLLAGALALHSLSYVVQVPQASIVAFFGGLYALMGLVWGPLWLRASFFPMILFAFAVPLGSLGEPITFPLRMLATNITAGFCQNVLGIDVIQKGTQLFEPSFRYQYDVAAACGGIRSLTALLALTTLYGFMVFKTGWRRALMVLSAFPLAVAGNVFRLTSIIVAADAFSREAGNFVHDKLGLLPYVPAVAGIALLGYLLREQDPPAPVGLEPKTT